MGCRLKRLSSSSSILIETILILAKVDKGNRIENLKIDIHIYGQLVLEKLQTQFTGEKSIFHQKVLKKLDKYMPGDSDGKESAYSVGDMGSILGSERSPGEEKGYPF